MKTLQCTLVALVVGMSLAAVAEARPPFWDDRIDGPRRFQVLNKFDGAAVFDRETGLVWEQAPSTTSSGWLDAHEHCNGKTVGGRKGWRLPTVQELASLVDPNNPGGNPDLPPDHPFDDVQAATYWSATTFADASTGAWDVNLLNGNVVVVGKLSTLFVWCVRGGQGVDPQ